jgi:hypothetical protein
MGAVIAYIFREDMQRLKLRTRQGLDSVSMHAPMSATM